MRIAGRDNFEHQHQDIRLIVSVGFSLVIGLLILIIAGSYYTMGNQGQALSTTISETTIKIDMAHRMRDAIRQRVNSLQTMLNLQDPFERDAEKMAFFSYASNYAHARETLHQHLISPREFEIFNIIDNRARAVGPPNKEALRLLFEVDHSPELETAVNESISGHLSLLSGLDDLVKLEHANAKLVIAEEKTAYEQAIAIGSAIGVVAITLAIFTAFRVIHSAGRKNAQLSYQASHDALTGLSNRQAFENMLSWTIGESAEIPSNHVLLFMDLDQFKIVNDTCGHAAGDALLVQLSERLTTTIRTSDVLARLGGDEFGVLLRYTSPDSGEQVAEKIRTTVKDFDFCWDDRNFKIGVSIGMVPFSGADFTLEELMKTADTSCYTAKDQGRNRIHRADHDYAEIDKRTGEMMWVQRINDAVENDHFELFGQWINPITGGNADTSQPLLEVLLRMKSPDGLIAPGMFMPAAERYGLMTDIDRWVLDNALAWLASLDDRIEDMRISVNIFGRSASDPHFHEYIEDRIHHYAIRPESLCLEITESVAVGMESAAKLIEAVGGLGCRFAIDDFGSGLASFQYLRNLDVDYLKIDGSFIRDIENNQVDHAMVHSINEIGQTLGKRTVAEFVETEKALKALKEIGVDYAQGYHEHRPQPLSEICDELPTVAESQTTKEVAWASV